MRIMFLIVCLALPGCQRKNGDDTGSKSTTTAQAPASGKRTTLASGVQYEDLIVGSGAAIAKGQIANCHATGWLTDGTKFWSSHDGPNRPLDFTLRSPGVIRGWVDGVPGMKAGGKRKLWIPAELAYGAQGRPPRIPPNSDLVFEIELVAIR
jgi:FKBP-type peptidyl-prolyl cis-trans isomerase FkpA